MGLTVRCISVKKLAVRRKKLNNFNPKLLKKINLRKFFLSTMCYFVSFRVNRSRNMATILTVNRKKFSSVGPPQF